MPNLYQIFEYGILLSQVCNLLQLIIQLIYNNIYESTL